MSACVCVCVSACARVCVCVHCKYPRPWLRFIFKILIFKAGKQSKHHHGATQSSFYFSVEFVLSLTVFKCVGIVRLLEFMGYFYKSEHNIATYSYHVNITNTKISPNESMWEDYVAALKLISDLYYLLKKYTSHPK